MLAPEGMYTEQEYPLLPYSNDENNSGLTHNFIIDFCIHISFLFSLFFDNKKEGMHTAQENHCIRDKF